MKFLVVGCGSIGKRHLSNLRLLSAGEVIAKLADAKINQWERGPEWS